MRMILLVLALAPGTAFMAHAPRRFAVQAPRVSPFAAAFSPDEAQDNQGRGVTGARVHTWMETLQGAPPPCASSYAPVRLAGRGGHTPAGGPPHRHARSKQNGLPSLRLRSCSSETPSVSTSCLSTCIKVPPSTPPPAHATYTPFRRISAPSHDIRGVCAFRAR